MPTGYIKHKSAHPPSLIHVWYCYVIVVPWFVRLYVEIIHELKLAKARVLSRVQVDNHGITILYHLYQCRPCTLRGIDKSDIKRKYWYVHLIHSTFKVCIVSVAEQHLWEIRGDSFLVSRLMSYANDDAVWSGSLLFDRMSHASLPNAIVMLASMHFLIVF